MARTPLLRKLQAHYQDFAEAERSGKPAERVQEERRHRAWTRRDFIKATGATVGAAALSGPITAFAGQPPRIAIVGGGIAGLNAALTLRDAGYASTVYEAFNSDHGSEIWRLRPPGLAHGTGADQ